MDGETLRTAPRELHSPRLRLLAPAVDFAPALFEAMQASFDRLGFVGFGQTPWSLERATSARA
jgi:hypothetical protein